MTLRKALAAAGSAVFFVVAPSTVAGVIPAYLTGWQMAGPAWRWWPVRAIGAVVATGGAAVLLHSFVQFVTEGAGTPAPVAPTERLVVGGFYRYVRNPMYLAVTATIVGQALLLERTVLLVYAAGVWLTMAGFAHAYEEPALARRFGDEYLAYRQVVRAWCPRRHPPSGSGERCTERG